MGLFDDIPQEPAAQPTAIKSLEPVVIAQKQIHKGWFFGAISNGNAQLDLGNGKGIKITLTGKDFVFIQILETGIGASVRNQTWNRVKVEKQVVTKEVVRAPKREEMQTIGIVAKKEEELAW
jgi:hypothetical protein